MMSPARLVNVWAHLVSPHASPENTEIINSSLKGWSNMTTKSYTYLCKNKCIHTFLVQTKTCIKMWIEDGWYMYISELSNCNIILGTYCMTCSNIHVACSI